MGGDALQLGSNRRSGTGHVSQALVVLCLLAQGLEEGDEHPPMLSCGAWLTVDFTFTITLSCNKI